MSTSRKILLVDDDVELVTLLADYLSLDGLNPTAVHSGPDALAELAKTPYALVVLDVMMPGMSGVEVLKKIRSTLQTPVLMLTARGDQVDRIIGLELGADDYVPKPCPPRELVARIHAILRRTGHIEPSNMVTDPIICGPLTIDSAQRSCKIDGQPLELTSTEFALMEMLVRNVGRPVKKQDIYRKVLGRPYTRFDRAIDVHVSATRHKLVALAGDSLIIESIRGVGYQLVCRPTPFIDGK